MFLDVDGKHEPSIRSGTDEVSVAAATFGDMTDRMSRSRDIARRSNMFRIYRDAGVLQGLLNAAIIYEHAIAPEVDAALTALQRLLPYAHERSVGDLNRAGTPEARELLDAVTESVAEWDALTRRNADEDEDEDEWDR